MDRGWLLRTQLQPHILSCVRPTYADTQKVAPFKCSLATIFDSRTKGEFEFSFEAARTVVCSPVTETGTQIFSNVRTCGFV